jgi:hypothetical protein
VPIHPLLPVDGTAFAVAIPNISLDTGQPAPFSNPGTRTEAADIQHGRYCIKKAPVILIAFTRLKKL